MQIYRCSQLTLRQMQDVVSIWNSEYPHQICYDSVDDFSKDMDQLVDPVHLLMEEPGEPAMGWMLVFTAKEQRWFMLLLNSQSQGKGLGSQLLSKAKQIETELHGWVVDHDRDVKRDGTPYRSPIGFYLKNGFEVVSDVRQDNEKVSTVMVRWRR